MTLDSVLLFVHVLGAVGLLAAVAVDASALWLAARARSELRAVLGLTTAAGWLAPASMLSVLASGGWMMHRGWGPQPWILAGLAALAWIGVTGAAGRRRLARLRRSLEGTGPVAPALPAPGWSRLGAGGAALALMTLRPGWPGSIALLAAGLLVSVLVPRSLRGRRPQRDTEALGA